MICKKCGTMLQDGELFCPNCGEKAETEGTAQQTVTIEPTIEIGQTTVPIEEPVRENTQPTTSGLSALEQPVYIDPTTMTKEERIENAPVLDFETVETPMTTVNEAAVPLAEIPVPQNEPVIPTTPVTDPMVEASQSIVTNDPIYPQSMSNQVESQMSESVQTNPLDFENMSAPTAELPVTEVASEIKPEPITEIPSTPVVEPATQPVGTQQIEPLNEVKIEPATMPQPTVAQPVQSTPEVKPTEEKISPLDTSALDQKPEPMKPVVDFKASEPSKKNSPVMLIIIVLLILVIAGLGYYIFTLTKDGTKTNTNTPTTTSKGNNQEYRIGGFKFSAPSDWAFEYSPTTFVMLYSNKAGDALGGMKQVAGNYATLKENVDQVKASFTQAGFAVTNASEKTIEGKSVYVFEGNYQGNAYAVFYAEGGPDIINISENQFASAEVYNDMSDDIMVTLISYTKDDSAVLNNTSASTLGSLTVGTIGFMQ